MRSVDTVGFITVDEIVNIVVKGIYLKRVNERWIETSMKHP